MKKLVAIRMEKEQEAQIRELAGKTGMTFSGQLRGIVDFYFRSKWYKKIFHAIIPKGRTTYK